MMKRFPTQSAEAMQHRLLYTVSPAALHSSVSLSVSLSQWGRWCSYGAQELNPSLLGDNLKTNRVKSTSVPCDLWVISYMLTA